MLLSIIKIEQRFIFTNKFLDILNKYYIRPYINLLYKYNILIIYIIYNIYIFII